MSRKKDSDSLRLYRNKKKAIQNIIDSMVMAKKKGNSSKIKELCFIIVSLYNYKDRDYIFEQIRVNSYVR